MEKKDDLFWKGLKLNLQLPLHHRYRAKSSTSPLGGTCSRTFFLVAVSGAASLANLLLLQRAQH